MERKIIIEFFTGEKPLEKTQDTQASFTVETLIIESCKYLNIGPCARHLFGLWCPLDGLWLPPSMKIHLSNNKTWLLHLKIRFKVPSVRRLVVSNKCFDFYLIYYINYFLIYFYDWFYFPFFLLQGVGITLICLHSVLAVMLLF